MKERDRAKELPCAFGKYVLMERISVGGMAEVFKAKSFGVDGFEKMLAIKRILPALVSDAEFVEMFVDEAKICGQLTHANVCQIYELGRVGEAHFIAMEYVWGKNLLQAQSRFRKLKKAMNPEMAVYILSQLCEGLDYAHRKKDAQGLPLGIIHRDISPQNVLINYEGEIKLIDFGIAKAATSSTKTQAGVLKGKFGYMSPEQVRGQVLDRRSDIFALGTLFFEILTGKRLFLSESDFETLEKVRNVDVPSMRELYPEVPPALEAICARALTKDVRDRYQWASEMQEDLHAYERATGTYYTGKHLANWMHEQFAAEMAAEQQVLDEQRKIGREVLTAPIAESFGLPALPVAARALTAPPDAITDRSKAPPTTRRERADTDSELPQTALSRPQLGRTAADNADTNENILDLSEEDLAAIPEILYSEEGETTSPDGQMPADPVELPTPSMRSGPHARTIMGEAAPLPVGPVVSSVHRLNDPTSNVTLHRVSGEMSAPVSSKAWPPLPYAPVRKAAWHDVALGMVIATLLVGLGIGGWVAYAGRSRAELLISVREGVGVELTVNGNKRGTVSVGAPLRVKGLTQGHYEIVGQWSDGSTVTRRVEIPPGSHGPVALDLAAPQRLGFAQIRITPPNARVWIDDQVISEQLRARPIPLAAGVTHRLRVLLTHHAEYKGELNVKAGEKIERAVKLEPGLGQLRVVSNGSPADVLLNGKRVGVAPVSLSGLDPAHSFEVKVRLRGYPSIVKTIRFDDSLEKQVEANFALRGAPKKTL